MLGAVGALQQETSLMFVVPTSGTPREFIPSMLSELLITVMFLERMMVPHT